MCIYAVWLRSGVSFKIKHSLKHAQETHFETFAVLSMLNMDFYFEIEGISLFIDSIPSKSHELTK